jgi:hypothetical protein
MKNTIVILILLLNNLLVAQITDSKKDAIKVLNITIPEAIGSNSISHRFGYPNYIITQFSSANPDLLYVVNDNNEQYYSNDYVTAYLGTKMIGRISNRNIKTTDIGKEIMADVNKDAEYVFNILDRRTSHDQKSIGYIDKKLRIKTNNDAPFDLLKNDNCPLTLVNYQENKDVYTFENFTFWSDKNDKKEFFKKLKTDFFKWADERKIQTEVKSVMSKEPATLTDIKASYSADRSIAHVVFTFLHPYYYGKYYLLYDIDFKNKTSKKLGESKFAAILNDDHFIYTVFKTWDATTKKSIEYQKLINFDDNNSIVDLDKNFYDKINKIRTTDENFLYCKSNKDFIVFNLWHFENKNDRFCSYYFINKKTLECDKIVNLHTPNFDSNNYNYSISSKGPKWNKYLDKSAYTIAYKLYPTDENYVSSIYIIDWNTGALKLLSDHEYQLTALRKKDERIALDKVAIDKLDASNREITKINEEINNAGHTCWMCKGTGHGDKSNYIKKTEIKDGKEITTYIENVCVTCHGTGILYNRF